MEFRFLLAVLFVLIFTADAYYSSRKCYGTGDCHLMTKNQDGGYNDTKHQWLVECNDGEGAVAIRDDDTHFEGLSGLWCSFLFPYKQNSRGVYPFYPQCFTRNLTNGEYHCRADNDGTNSTQLFVTAMYKEPSSSPMFVPSTMKCCETPTGYEIDYGRCYYKKTFDRYGEHYTGEWLVKCDSHHLMTGIGKDVNPWDNKPHFTWIQCCPFYYKQSGPSYQTQDPSMSTLIDQTPLYKNLIPGGSPGPSRGPFGITGRSDAFEDATKPMPSPPRPSFTRYLMEKLFKEQPNQYPQPTPFMTTPFGTGYGGVSEAFPPGNMWSWPNGFTGFEGYNGTFGGEVGGYFGPGGYPNYQTGQGMMMPSPFGTNMAAYKHFMKMYRDMKQQPTTGNFQSPPGFPPGYGEPNPGFGSAPPPSYLFGGSWPAEPTLGAAASQFGDPAYAVPPLPTGLQNMMQGASKNPTETLSKLYGQADQFGHMKGYGYGGMNEKNQFFETPNFDFVSAWPIFKTSKGQNYKIMFPAHYERLKMLPVSYRQMYVDFLGENYPNGLETPKPTTPPGGPTTVPLGSTTTTPWPMPTNTTFNGPMPAKNSTFP